MTIEGISIVPSSQDHVPYNMSSIPSMPFCGLVRSHMDMRLHSRSQSVQAVPTADPTRKIAALGFKKAENVGLQNERFTEAAKRAMQTEEQPHKTQRVKS